MKILAQLRSSQLRRGARWVELILGASVAAAALWQIGALLRVFCLRMAFPFDLEWCEGGSLYHAWRLLEGAPLYGPADAVFQPFPYPPAYYGLVAAVGALTGGVDYWNGRLISIVFFAILTAALARETYRHAGNGRRGALLALAVAASIASGFPVVDGWFDLARVDTMSIALAVLAAALVSGAHRLGGKRLVLVAIVLTATVYTKQTHATFAAWIVAYAVLRHRGAGLRLGALTLALGLGASALAFVLTDGNFWRVLVVQPQGHAIDTHKLEVALERIQEHAPYAIALPLASIAAVLRGGMRSRTLLWTGMLVAALPAALLPFAKWGGHWNNLTPIVVLLGPVAAMVALDLAPRIRSARSFTAATVAAGLVALVVATPLEPEPYLPTPAMWGRAEALNRMVAGLDGGVVSPPNPFLSARNGHRNENFHTMGYADMGLSGVTYDMGEVLDRAGAEWALVTSTSRSTAMRVLRGRYVLVERFGPDRIIPLHSGGPIVLDELRRRRPQR